MTLLGRFYVIQDHLAAEVSGGQAQNSKKAMKTLFSQVLGGNKQAPEESVTAAEKHLVTQSPMTWAIKYADA